MAYWDERAKDLKKWMESSEEKLKKRLAAYYEKEYERLDKEIAAYYSKYGQENVLEYRTLLQKLSDEDIQLLMEKMDEFAMKYPNYGHLLPVRESIYKLDRLEGLQYSVVMQQHEMAMKTNEEMTAYLNKLSIKSGNYARETMGFGKNFYSIDSDFAKRYVDVPWSNGENFSARIWDDTNRLANYLNQDISAGFARGDSYEKLAKQLKDRFNRVSKNNAYRLIYTEGTYVMNESAMGAFEEDYEEYQISTVEDSRVCPICRAMADKTFRIEDRKPGVNFPPFHPWCRCSFIIVINDPEGLGADDDSNGIEKHDSAIMLGNTDQKDINKTIKDYETSILKDEIETALVIAKDGRTYKCFGTLDRVFIDSDLGKEILDGSTVSHWHVPSETSYSFSSDDLKLFMKYNLSVLRGSDDKYVYELNRNSEDVDSLLDDWMTVENFQHCTIIRKAIEKGIGYRRWKK